MLPPVILITGCQKYIKYLHASIRRMEIRQKNEVIGIVGDLTCFVETFDPITKILTLPVSDTYEDLPKKIHAAMSWIFHKRPHISGVFNTDDDIVFDLNFDLTDLIYKHANVPYWGVAVGSCTSASINRQRILARFSDTTLAPSHQTAVYSFGWGYWISKDTLPHIVAASDDYESSFLEDVCTGFVLNRVGIFPERIRPLFKECPRGQELLDAK